MLNYFYTKTASMFAIILANRKTKLISNEVYFMACRNIFAMTLMMSFAFPAYSAGPSEDLARVVILPFEDQTGSSDYGYLADSLSDAVNTSMQKNFTYERVTPEEAVKSFADSAKKVRADKNAPKGKDEELVSIFKIMAKDLKADILVFGYYTMNSREQKLVIKSRMFYAASGEFAEIPELSNKLDNTIFSATDKVASSIISEIKKMAQSSADNTDAAEKMVAANNQKSAEPAKIVLTKKLAKKFARFRDNNDGSITDSKTGLVWQKCVTDSSGKRCTNEISKDMAAASATIKCTALTIGNKNWSLPTKDELLTLVNPNASKPKINILFAPYTDATKAYFTSTLNSGNESLGVSFEDGSVSTISIKNANPYDMNSYYSNFRCVARPSDNLPAGVTKNNQVKREGKPQWLMTETISYTGTGKRKELAGNTMPSTAKKMSSTPMLYDENRKLVSYGLNPNVASAGGQKDADVEKIFDKNGKLEKTIKKTSTQPNYNSTTETFYNGQGGITKSVTKSEYQGATSEMVIEYNQNGMPSKTTTRSDYNGVKTEYVSESVVDSSGKNVKTITTSNGKIASITTFVYNKDGKPVKQLTSADPGKDGKWETGDDLHSSIAETSYTKDGQLLKIVSFVYPVASANASLANPTNPYSTYTPGNSNGPDGKPETSDDVPQTVIEYVYDSNGKLSRTINYSYVKIEINVQKAYAGLLTGMMQQAMPKNSDGPDGKPGTKDDVPASVVEYVYDENGNVSKTVTYTDSGADKKWFTDDDVWTTFSVSIWELL